MEIEQIKELNCNNCNKRVFSCDYHNEEFKDKDIIYCINDYANRYHICRECYLNFIKTSIKTTLVNIPKYIKDNKKVK